MRRLFRGLVGLLVAAAAPALLHAADPRPFGLVVLDAQGKFVPDVQAEEVRVLENGELRDALVSSRCAKEYGLTVNAGRESPHALEVAAGDLSTAQALEALDTGLYVSNL